MLLQFFIRNLWQGDGSLTAFGLRLGDYQPALASQACLERVPQARQYYSDAFPVYDTLYYGAPYEMRTDKQEIYSVEAVNADLVITSNAWLANPDAFPDECIPWLEIFNSLYTVTTKDN
jgi:hypothetical protein